MSDNSAMFSSSYNYGVVENDETAMNLLSWLCNDDEEFYLAEQSKGKKEIKLL